MTLKEINVAISQVVAELLKIEVIALSQNFAGLPPFGHLATYDDVDVVEVDDRRCKVRLPAVPLKLPLQIGIYSVYSHECPDCLFIPVQSGALPMALATQHNGLSAMLSDDLIPYTPSGRYIEIRRPKSEIGDTVSMQLIIADPDSLTDSDDLGIPPDYQDQIVKRVVDRFRARGVHDESNDGRNN